MPDDELPATAGDSNLDLGQNPFHPDNLSKTLDALDDESAPAEEPPKPNADPETPVGDEPPAETPAETVPDPTLILGRFKTMEDLAEAYKNLEVRFGQQGNELGQVRQQAGQKPPEETPPPKVVDDPPAEKHPNRGQVFTSDWDEHIKEYVEKLFYGTDEATGFPLDEFGTPFIPDSFWQKRHLKWMEEKGLDEEDALIAAGREQGRWEKKYNFQRSQNERAYAGEAQQEARRQHLQAIEGTKKLEQEEVPVVKRQMTQAFVSVLPEAQAVALTDKLLTRGSQMIAEAVTAGRMTPLDAAKPGTVLECVAAALYEAVKLGTLGEMFLSVVPNSVPKGNANSGGGSVAGNTSGGAAAKNGAGQGAVKNAPITPEAKQLAKAFKVTEQEAANNLASGEWD